MCNLISLLIRLNNS